MSDTETTPDLARDMALAHYSPCRPRGGTWCATHDSALRHPDEQCEIFTDLLTFARAIQDERDRFWINSILTGDVIVCKNTGAQP